MANPFLECVRPHAAGAAGNGIRKDGMGKGHFRASFEPISKRVILAEGPGITGSQLNRLKHKKVRRPIFPLDTDASYQHALKFLM